MPQLELTVVIPYSGDSTIARTLRSLSRQSGMKNKCEAIVVTDGDLDINSFMSGITFPFPIRVKRYFRKPDFRGHSAGAMRNFGAASARGRYLVFVDSDCVLKDDCLRQHYLALVRHPGWAICGKMNELPATHHSMSGSSFERMAANCLDDSRSELEASDGELTKCSWLEFYSCNASVPAKLFHLAGGFDESGFRCHDMDLGYKLHRAGALFAYAPKAAVIHVEHPRSLVTRLEQARGWELIGARYPEISDLADDQVLMLIRSYERVRHACETSFSQLVASIPGTRIDDVFVVSPRLTAEKVEDQIASIPHVVSRGIDSTYYSLGLERNCWDYQLIHSDTRISATPAVSVVVTTFNSSEYISRALESVFAQSLQSFELVVVDDASADNTIEIVDSYASDGRLRVICRAENGGLSRALNTALEVVRAPLFVQLDADDWLEQHALEILSREFEAGPDLAAIYGSPIIHSGDTAPFVEKGYATNSPLELLAYRPAQAPRAYRVSALRKLGGWSTSDTCEGRYFEDRLMLSRLAKRHRVGYVEEPLYHLWESPNSLARSMGSTMAVARYDISWHQANLSDAKLTGPVLTGGWEISFEHVKHRKPRRSWSVIIPARNRVELLKYCLASWFQSDLFESEGEIIVVDDGSDTPLEKALSELARPIRIIRENRQRGPSWCRNRGAAVAKGEMLFFSDSDQIVPPRVIESHERHHFHESRSLVLGGLLGRRCFSFAERPSALEPYLLKRLLDLLTFEDDFDDIAGRIALDAPLRLLPLGEDIWLRSQKLSFTGSYVGSWISIVLWNGGNLNDYCHRWMATGTGSTSISKQLFDNLGGFASSMPSMEDWEFGARAQSEDVTITFAPEAQSLHQIHPESDWAAVEARSRRALERRHPKLVAVLKTASEASKPPGAEVFRYPSLRSRPHGLRRVDKTQFTDASVCALTFDDGPHPVGTSLLLDLFDKAQIKATFFVLGKEITRHKALCKRLANSGHEIGVHGWTHAAPKLMTGEEIFISLKKTVVEIAELTGLSPRFTRPCFGQFTPSYEQAASRLGLVPVGWHLSTGDWAACSLYESKRHLAVSGVKGKVLLFHDGAGDPEITAGTVRWLLNCLVRENAKFATLSEYAALSGGLPS